jgi:mannose-1-phosphate guanylyltransferase
MRAMLVAAGVGTRLDPLTRELPKPALPVANRPIAWFACDHLLRAGFDELVVNTHHLAGELRAALEPHVPAGQRLRFVHEPQILGTGGGVRNAWQRPIDGEDFVTMNAKLLFAPDLARALAVHRQSGAIATMVLRALPAGTRFTPVQVAVDGRVIAIGDVAAAPDAAVARATASARMFTGVQVLSPRAFADLPESGDIIRYSYARWLARGELVATVTDDAPFMDVGVTLRHYLDANVALAAGALRWPGVAPAPGGVFVDAAAQLGAGCALENAAVGAGASVAPGTRLQRVVLWPGTRTTTDLRDAIVTPSRVLQL